MKKAFFIIVPAVILLSMECGSIAGNDWQLDNSLAEMSDAEEIELGKQVDAYVRQLFYFENDPGLNTTVNVIAQRLIAVSERNILPFTCTIIQSYSINAFSAPGGHIYLTCGLLKFAETEDEVAGIIGHEIAHASLRHASKLYREVMEFVSHSGEGTDSAASFLLFHNHLEEFEEDADTAGVLYAHKAGFNPRGLPDFLERHLNLMIHKNMFGIFGSGSLLTINSRINHLRNYILTLEKEGVRSHEGK